MELIQIADSNGISIKQKFEEDEEYKIYHNDKHVGDAQIYLHEVEIKIDNIDIYPQFKFNGYGKKVIEMLKSIPSVRYLHGESVGAAMGFWTKMGALFDQKDLNEWIEADDNEYDGLVGFTIKC